MLHIKRKPSLLILGTLLAGACLAAAVTVCAGQVSAPETVMVISADGTVITAPMVAAADGTTLQPAAGTPNAVAPKAVTGIYTSEGVWTFGAPPNASGDYPLLLNGSNANGGFAGMLQVTNGNLYAMIKSGGFWVRWAAAWLPAGKPAQGTVAAKLAIAMLLPQTPDNSPAGTVIAKATVTMSPATAPFTGPLVSTNPLYTFQGSNIVLSRALTAADDGTHNAVATAVQ
jgi:hypothetical protein